MHQRLRSNLRRLRLHRGFTQETLAHKAGVTYATIVKLESGVNTNPTIKTLLRIARALKVTLDDLVR